MWSVCIPESKNGKLLGMTEKRDVRKPRYDFRLSIDRLAPRPEVI
jgi:hypothetical protein